MIFATLAATFAALGCLTEPQPGEASSTLVVDMGASQAAVEYFLVSAPADGVGTEPGEPIAVVALRSIEGAAPAVDFLFEREIVFAAGGLRVRHTETGMGDTRRLVWREFLPSASRTWVADWTAGQRGAVARSIAYGWNRPVHERVMSQVGTGYPVFGPLELLYRTRTGALACGDTGGTVGVIDPSSAAIVEGYRSSVAVGSEVSADVRRTDGSLLMGADFTPGTTAFLSLRLSDRAAVTQPIGLAEFERLSRRWTVECRRPYDAMLALIPSRR